MFPSRAQRPCAFAAGKDGPAPEWQPVQVRHPNFATISGEQLTLFRATAAEEQPDGEKYVVHYFSYEPNKLIS